MYLYVNMATIYCYYIVLNNDYQRVTISGWWWREPWNFMTFHSVGNFIIPTYKLIFFRGVGQPPTQSNSPKKIIKVKSCGWLWWLSKLNHANLSYFNITWQLKQIIKVRSYGWLWWLSKLNHASLSYFNITWQLKQIIKVRSYGWLWWFTSDHFAMVNPGVAM